MSDMPWDRVELRGWSIIRMSHYYVNGVRQLFVAMVKDGHRIHAEGSDEHHIWIDLATQAFRIRHDMPLA